MDEYIKKRKFTTKDKIRIMFLKPIWWIDDRIEELKYKLYVKLYVWFDCLPPDERDLPNYEDLLEEV